MIFWQTAGVGESEAFIQKIFDGYDLFNLPLGEVPVSALATDDAHRGEINSRASQCLSCFCETPVILAVSPILNVS